MMALIKKERNEDNESPKLKKYENTFAREKRFIQNMFIYIFLVAVLILIVMFAMENFLLKGLPLLIVLGIVFVYHEKKLEKLDGLTSYQEYSQAKSKSQNIKKGEQGEDTFIALVSNILDDSYAMMNNVYLPYNQEYLQQVDSILISGRGNIYVVEVKNWSGVISGNINNLTWLTDAGPRKNPYLQNEYHLMTLQKEMGLSLTKETEMHNLVVNMDYNSFINLCKYDKNEKHIFENVLDLADWIKNHEKNSPMDIDLEKQRDIIEKIYDIHCRELSRFEEKINEELLEEFNYLLEPEINFEPQTSD